MSFRIRIQALNSLGAGPFSHTIKLKTKPLPPDPPRLECVAFNHQNLKLKWGEGTPKTLSTDAVQYHLQMEDKNGRWVYFLFMYIFWGLMYVNVSSVTDLPEHCKDHHRGQLGGSVGKTGCQVSQLQFSH